MIGIISDSHDNLTTVRRAVRIFSDMGCRLVIHAGDFVAPFAAAELRELRCPIKAVFGNCDGEKEGLAAIFEGMGKIVEAPLAFEHAGLRFRVFHLDSPVREAVRTGSCDVLIYGHTHKPEVRRENGVLIVNPGEAGGWLHRKSTVAVLDPKTLDVEVVPI